MRVWIETCDTPIDKLSGKGLFCRRLADALRERGVTVTADRTELTDFALCLIRLTKVRAAKKILRIDGVWHDTGKNWRKKNFPIKDSLYKADGVIYQSEFARNMGDRYLGEPNCPTTVIPNGSLPGKTHSSPVAQNRVFTPPATGVRPAAGCWRNQTGDGAAPQSENGGEKPLFLAFAKWRPHKRLREVILAYLSARIPGSELVVAGDLTNSGLTAEELKRYFFRPNHTHIKHLGHLNQTELAGLLARAAASIHLCWFDACPNSVVEAICAGVPVITNNVGGTWEIVLPSGGYVLPLDQPYDFEPVDLYSPPKIDHEKVAAAMRHCVASPPRITCDHVDINHIADRYINFMEAL